MDDPPFLVSGRRLLGHSAWNLAGLLAPLAVALWAIPLLVDGLGKPRFGLLAIVWLGVGYFSVFDFGVGRALTWRVAQGLGRGEPAAQLAGVARLALRLLAILGVAAALLLAALTPALVDVLDVPPALRDDARRSFWLLALTVPLVVSSAGMIGLLQAHQRFRAIAAVRVPLGVATFAAPVLALQLSPSLTAVTTSLALTRLAAWLAYAWLSRAHRAGAPHHGPQELATLLGFGGWLTVSNFVSPLMVSFDRIAVGALLGLAAVAYYTAPHDVLTRLLVVPAALADAFLPAVASALAADPQRAARLFRTALHALVLMLWPVAAMVVLLAPAALALWLGPEFALQGAAVARWLALGLFLNALAQLPSALLLARGRPDLNARLHLVELPLYAAVLGYLLTAHGIVGAAMAWTARVGFDAVLLFVVAARAVPALRDEQRRALLLLALGALALFGLAVVSA